MRITLRNFFIGFILFSGFFCIPPVSALESPAVQDSRVPVRFIKWPLSDKVPQDFVPILKNTSQVFRFNRTIIRAAVSNPTICDITNVGQTDLLIFARDAGLVTLFVWDEEENIATYTVESTLDTKKLEKLLGDVDTRSNLKIVPFNRSVAVYGTADTSVKLKQIEDAAKAFDPNVLNFVHLKESKQILLEARFAEIDRRASKNFKVDFDLLGGYQTFASSVGQTGAFDDVSGDSSYTTTPGGRSYTVPDRGSVGGGGSANIFLTYVSRSVFWRPYLEWLEQKNILKVVARPNLVTKDGEEGKFIVGGEFPVATSSTNGVSFTYKEFGNKLEFKPEILDDGFIRLKMVVEVSELDFSSTVTSGGATVPVINKRRTETIAEVKDNETLVIGGIITQKVQKINRKAPVFSDLPLIGTFFKGEEYSRTDVELVIIITPHIISPMHLGEAKPFYNPEDVKKAMQTFTPPYDDRQADAINHMLTGTETRDNQFGQIPKKELELFAEDMQRKIENAKKKIAENKPKPVATPPAQPYTPNPNTDFIKGVKRIEPVPSPTPLPAKKALSPAPQKISIPKPTPTPTPAQDLYQESPFYTSPSASSEAPSEGNRGSFSGGYIKPS